MTLNKIFNNRVVTGLAVAGSFILGAESNDTKYEYYEITALDGSENTMRFEQPTLYDKMVKWPFQQFIDAVDEQFSDDKPRTYFSPKALETHDLP